jgi:selenide,water dikinase
MTELNLAGRNAMVKVGVNAATDITGFGLIGHGYELAAASGVQICIESGTVPLLANVMEMAGKKCLTRAHKTNLAFVGERFESGGVAEELVNVLGDAQTSGGLLISVAPGGLEGLLAALAEQGCARAARIGSVERGEAPGVVLR